MNYDMSLARVSVCVVGVPVRHCLVLSPWLASKVTPGRRTAVGFGGRGAARSARGTM